MLNLPTQIKGFLVWHHLSWDPFSSRKSLPNLVNILEYKLLQASICSAKYWYCVLYYVYSNEKLRPCPWSLWTTDSGSHQLVRQSWVLLITVLRFWCDHVSPRVLEWYEKWWDLLRGGGAKRYMVGLMEILSLNAINVLLEFLVRYVMSELEEWPTPESPLCFLWFLLVVFTLFLNLHND